jgi:hypothetical protein
LHGVLSAVKELERQPKGLQGRFKEIIHGKKTAEDIIGYGRKIRELRSNFVVFAICSTSRNMLTQISAYCNYGHQLSSSQGLNCDIAWYVKPQATA